jgi:hypothetical protein
LFLAGVAITLMPSALMAYLVWQDPAPRILVKAENMGGDPSRAVRFMVANQASGNVFNPLGWGGYLLWHLPPQMKISVDGRSSTVYPRSVLLETYRFYNNEAETHLPLAKGADFVLVEAKSPVVHPMTSDKRWSVAYRDESAIVFAGPTPAGRQVMERLKAGRARVPEENVKARFP